MVSVRTASAQYLSRPRRLEPPSLASSKWTIPSYSLRPSSVSASEVGALEGTTTLVVDLYTEWWLFPPLMLISQTVDACQCC